MEYISGNVHELNVNGRFLAVCTMMPRNQSIVNIRVFEECVPISVPRLYDPRMLMSFMASNVAPVEVCDRIAREFVASPHDVIPVCYAYHSRGDSTNVFSAFAQGDSVHYAIVDESSVKWQSIPFSVVVSCAHWQIVSLLLGRDPGVIPLTSSLFPSSDRVVKRLYGDLYSVELNYRRKKISTKAEGSKAFRCNTQMPDLYHSGDTYSTVLGKVFVKMSNRKHREAWLLGIPEAS